MNLQNIFRVIALLISHLLSDFYHISYEIQSMNMVKWVKK